MHLPAFAHTLAENVAVCSCTETRNAVLIIVKFMQSRAGSSYEDLVDAYSTSSPRRAKLLRRGKRAYGGDVPSVQRLCTHELIGLQSLNHMVRQKGPVLMFVS